MEDDSIISRYHRIETQMVRLPAIDTPGWILDVGGGGEGVIGQLCGPRVIAIDRIRQELEEAPGEALKVVMDAGNLQFLDRTFQTATAFFALMFIPLKEMPKVFSEVLRVLRPGGRWLIWDITIPPYPGGQQDIFRIDVQVQLSHNQRIETGYGTLWPIHAQSADDFIRLAEQTGFKVLRCEPEQQHFYLELYKP